MKNLSAFTLGALPFACLLFACSSAPESDKTHTPGVGPIDGEIPGQGNGSGAASGAIPSPGSGGSGGPVGVGGSAGAGGSGGAAGSGGAGAAGGGGGAAGGAGTGATGGAGGAPPEPGTLTAGAWDDNRNFDRFLGYRSEIAAEQSFGMLGFSVDEHRSSHDMSASLLVPHELLDIALVIDTTGSMGDEIEYLKSELIAISGRIAALHPHAAQRWSLIVYRDSTDEYVVRWFGFREGVQEIQTRLAEQRADGGGDFPEAPDAAFRKLNELYWRAESNVARLAFWIADAPHHAQNAENFSTAVRRTRELGIRVYPIASSGIDGATELTMRSVAQITGGRYLFLTDDSGVGGPHLEPSIPCYFVTKLDDAMVRMVDIEMSGTYHEPAPDQILRTGGDPENGACRLDSGAVVAAY